MNKEKFLNELEKRLNVLSSEEKIDIINEYRDIIEEKVKHGKTEEEAVQEFGSINDLAKEILGAYKINPEYNNSDTGKKVKEFVDDCEIFIKKGAKKLSDVTEEVVDNFKKNDNQITTEKVFEIIIKVILILICLAFLRIPFYIISSLGVNLLGISTSPFDHIFGFLWRVLIEVAYLAIVVLLIYSLVSKYTKNSTITSKETKKKINNENKKEEDNDNFKNSKSSIVTNKKDGLGEAILILIKIWAVIVFLIPLWVTNISLVLAIAVAIYLIIKGVTIFGILILLLGIFGIISFFSELVVRLLFTKKRIRIWGLITSIVLIVIGFIWTFDYFMNLTYYNYLPTNVYSEKTVTYTKNIDGMTRIVENNKEIIVDNSLNDNEIKVEITYYSDFIKIYGLEVISNDNLDNIYIDLSDIDDNGINIGKTLNKTIIKDLKENKIYNYSLLGESSLKIYVNETTKSLIY